MPTLCVIDSNYLVDSELAVYLRNPENVVVLCDYVGLELFKAPDPVRMIHRSLEILMKSAGQALVLHRTVDLQRTPGVGRKYLPTMFDWQTSKYLAPFYQQVTQSPNDTETAKEIAEKRVEAIALAANAETSAREIVGFLPNFYRCIPKADIELLRKEGKLAGGIKDSLKEQAMEISRNIHEAKGISHDQMASMDLMHSYTFRYATTILIRMLRWFQQGAHPTNLNNIRNDAFDCGVVAYATYFDGLLTRDKKALGTYNEVTALLDEWYRLAPG